MVHRKVASLNWLLVGLAGGGAALLIGGLIWAFGSPRESILKHESAFERAVAITNDLADILVRVDDLPSAQAAVPQISKIGDRMGTLLREKSELEKSHPLSAEEQKELSEKYENSLQEAHNKVIEELERLNNHPEIALIALDAIQEVGNRRL